MNNNILLELRKSVAIIFLIVFLIPYLFSSTSVRIINLPKIKPSENKVDSVKSVNKILSETIQQAKIKPSETKVNAAKSVNKIISERKTILFWNSYWDDHYFEMGAGNIGK